MSSKVKISNDNSFPFISILTLIFVIAKILGYINWSWMIVFSPIWISVALVLVVVIIVIVCNAIVDSFQDK